VFAVGDIKRDKLGEKIGLIGVAALGLNSYEDIWVEPIQVIEFLLI